MGLFSRKKMWKIHYIVTGFSRYQKTVYIKAKDQADACEELEKREFPFFVSIIDISEVVS